MTWALTRGINAALVNVAIVDVAVDVELGRIIIDVVDVGHVVDVVDVIDVGCVVVDVGRVDDDDVGGVSSHVDDVGGALTTWMVR